MSAVSVAPDGHAPAPAPPALGRNWRLLFQGQAVSRVGNHVFDAAMGLWIYDAFGSASLMSLALLTTNLPAILLDPIGGVVADRFSRKRIVVLADLVSGLLVLGLAALVIFVPGAREFKMAAFIGVSLSLTVIGAFFNPAVGALLLDVVPRGGLPRALAFGQMSGQGAQLIGGPAAPTLYALLGAPALFVINGCSFLFAAASESLIRVADPPRVPPVDVGSRWAAFWRDLGEGLRFVRREPGLRDFLALTTATQLVAAPLATPLMIFYVEDVLALPRTWLSLTFGAFALGALAGSLVIMRMRPGVAWRRPLFIGCYAAGALGWITLGLVQLPVLTVAIAAGGGFATAVGAILTQAQLQERTPGPMRGRVLGLLGTVAGIMTAIGMGIGGPVADLSGHAIPPIYVGAGLIMLALTAAIAASRPIRTFFAADSYAG